MITFWKSRSKVKVSGDVCALLSLSSFIPVLLAVVVLDSVSSVLSQEIDWEERLQDDLF